MIWNTIGVLGISIVLCAYFFLQIEKVTHRDPSYLWANFVGSLGIIVSLTNNFNVASFIIESCWVLISIYGLIKMRNR